MATSEGRFAHPFFRGALVSLKAFSVQSARKLKAQGYDAVSFDVSSSSRGLMDAVEAARQARMMSYAWIQVGRDEKAAKDHPEWLHVPQHAEWLDGKGPANAAVYPWVCVNNKAVFDYELARVKVLLSNTKGLSGVFLADIQGPPNGCGCGNTACRSWDNSPGPKVADSPYKYPATFFSKVFAEAVQRAHPRLEVIPVLVGECENGLDVGKAANPDATSGACHGIPCLHPCSLDYYPGLLRALSGPKPVALFTPYKLFRRNRPEYGGEAAWVAASVERMLQYAPGQQPIAVLQGWDTTDAERKAQVHQARSAGAGYLMAMTPVDQSWEAVPTLSSGKTHTSH
jgi:hypothetical protein